MNEDAIPLAATPLVVLPDMNEADIHRECQAMLRRSYAMDEFLAGRMPIAEYFDYLEFDNISIPEYLDSWEENLDLLYDAA
jgi:hypothetical protein